MRGERLLDFMHDIAGSACEACGNLGPGETEAEGYYGDDKRTIDRIAEGAIVERYRDDGYLSNVAIKPEDASWGEDSWLMTSGEEIPGDKLTEEGVELALVVDPVEGTKNFPNRSRYTSVAAVDPEKPGMEGIEASMIYRWDGKVFFSDGEDSYSSRGGIEDASLLEAERVNSIDSTVKIRGQMIGDNAAFYSQVLQKAVERYSLEETDWPSLKADGTTTGDILGSVTDRSLAVDIRASMGRERLPFAQDFAPAAKIAGDAGARIVDEQGEKVKTDFTEPGSGTSYIAVPPGDKQEDLMEMAIEEIDRWNQGR